MLTFHQYQNELVREMISPGDLLVEAPTGCGKTAMAVASAKLMGLRGGGVLIATPQRQIEDAFFCPKYGTMSVLGQQLEVCEGDIMTARKQGSSSKEIQSFLDRNDRSHAMVCTHAALTKVRPPTSIPRQLKDFTLIVDEAHHAPAIGLSQFVQAWRGAGGRTIFLTATAYRADGIPVKLDGMRKIRRTMPRHMDEGFAPGRLDSGIVAVKGNGETVTQKQFLGDESPAENLQGKIISRMMSEWIADEKPKVIVRVPPMRGGSGEMVSKIVAAFSNIGARVLDISGCERDDRTHFLTEMKRERDTSESNFDIIVGVQRVAEGMDWPWCSTVYCVGLPASPHTAIQLVGRATRRKGDDYPEQHRNRAKIVFFVPVGDDRTLSRMPAHHGRNVLLFCSYLVNDQCGVEWAVVKEIGRGIRISLGKDVPIGKIENEYPYIDPSLRSQANAAIMEATDSLSIPGITPTDGAVSKWISEHRPEISQSVVKQIVAEQAISKGGEVSEEFCSKVADGLRDGHEITDAIKSAFDLILLDMETTMVVDSRSLIGLRKHLISLGASDIIEFARRLANARPLDPDWLADRLHDYKADYDVLHKKYSDDEDAYYLACQVQFDTGEEFAAAKPQPVRMSMPPKRGTSGGPNGWDETWRDIDQALASGGRSWPIPAVRSIDEFHRIYCQADRYCTTITSGMATGTIGRLLDNFVKSVSLSNVDYAFLSHLASENVKWSGNNGTIPFRLYPAFMETDGGRLSITFSRIIGNWVMRFARHGGLMSLGAFHALDLVDRMETWIHNEYQVSCGERNNREFTRCVSGTPVIYKIPSGRKVELYNDSMPSDGVLRIRRCHLSATRDCYPSIISGISSGDGLTIPVTVRLYDQTEFDFPIGWMTGVETCRDRVDGVEYLSDWREHLKSLPAATYDKYGNESFNETVYRMNDARSVA
jgi:hypothetical protein